MSEEPKIEEIIKDDEKDKEKEKDKKQILKSIKRDLEMPESELKKSIESSSEPVSYRVLKVKDVKRNMQNLFRRKKRKCNSKCPIYPCWASMLSGDEYDGYCALANLSPVIRKATIDILAQGEVGLTDEMLRTLLEYKYKVLKEPTPDNYKDYVASLVAVKKAIWGTKALTEIRIEDNRTKELIDGLKVAFDVIDLKEGKDYKEIESKKVKKENGNQHSE